jgi:hypothetical protein
LSALEGEIASLHAEIDRLHRVIEGSCDALMHLRMVYTDPKLPTSITTKAASCAVAYERSRPPAVAINAGISLYDALEKKRLQRLEAKPAVIDAKPDPSAA